MWVNIHDHDKHYSMRGKRNALGVRLPILNPDSALVSYVISGKYLISLSFSSPTYDRKMKIVVEKTK